VARRRLCSCGERFSTKEVITDSKQVSFKPVKALSMTKSVDGDWTVKVDENTPEWAKKMLINVTAQTPTTGASADTHINHQTT